MNERDNFIVEDLDDFHVIIKADEEYRVRKQLELEVCHYPKLAPPNIVALTFLSVREEHVQLGIIRLLPTVTGNVYKVPLIQARSRVYVSLQLPRYPWREFESRQRASERSNNFFQPIVQS
jgi:hypothetical protein